MTRASTLLFMVLAMAGLPFGLQFSHAEAPAGAGKALTLADLWEGRAVWALDVKEIGAEFKFHYVSIAPPRRHRRRVVGVLHYVRHRAGWKV